MSQIFRKHLFRSLFINNLTKFSAKSVKFNELTTNQLLIRYIKTSTSLLGTKGIPINMPSLSPTMATGTIVRWVKKEGDPIGPGDLICEIQTDKAVVGLELEEEGVMAKILLPDDSKDVKVGQLIGLMVEVGQDWKDVDIPKDVSSGSASTEEPQKDISEQKSVVKDNLIGPSVKKLLNHFGIDKSSVTPSGPRNILLKSDVLQYIESQQIKSNERSNDGNLSDRSPVESTAEPITAEYIDIELTNMRKTIAKRLTESKTTIPHCYMTANCVMNEVINTRKQLKQSAINVSVNDFIIKAAAIALKKVPQINCYWNEDTDTAQMLPTVDISIAVATPNGLITPIIKNANYLDLETIGKTIKGLAEKAREGRLQPNEFMGGSFSISNLGMFGITEFSAVINPPQSAIMAVGSTRRLFDDKECVQNLMTVTLSYDGRTIDEEVAATFLEVFQSILRDPVLLQTSDGCDYRRLNALIS